MKKRGASGSWEDLAEQDRQAAKSRKRLQIAKIGLATAVAAAFAILFLMPSVLTITNSFMAASEISANYGSVFAKDANGGKIYIAEKVNLKFIPDMVSFSQYNTVLLKSPEYLLKFWNSVILVAPIVIFQLIVASLASYGFARYRGKIREIIFFMYIILFLTISVLFWDKQKHTIHSPCKCSRQSLLYLLPFLIHLHYFCLHPIFSHIKL